MQNHKTGELEVATYRISKSAWLKDHEHKYIRDISRRVEDMTGLTTATAEELQVVNYGIGGHYEPHFDFARVRMTLHYGYFTTNSEVGNIIGFAITVTPVKVLLKCI